MRFSTFFATLGLALLMALALPAQTVRVIFVSGQASLQRPDEPALRPVVKGETVIIGTRIVTGADGRVILTPMPGVKSIVAPNTTILLESVSEVRTSETNVTHQAVIELKEGAIVSDLHKPEGVSYDYSIRTARGLAGARGTTFTVGMNAAGIQTIVVAHGSISISLLDGSKALLTPGQLSITKANGDTQSVGNVSELSEADQKIAKNWTETTISAISTALENGTELDPAALNNALDAAKSLGITLSPETQAKVDRVLPTTSTLFDKEKNPVNPPDPDIKRIVTETAKLTALERFRNQLTPAQQAAFDALPAAIQSKLVNINDLALTSIALGANPKTSQPFTNEDLSSHLDNFAKLTTEQKTVFDNLPADIQSPLFTIDPTLAQIALSPDRETGLPFTDQDLRIHLKAFAQLTPEAFAFIKTLASVSATGLENTPDPAAWSAEAFARTLTSWNALTDTERHTIAVTGAGEAIMDKSAGYISALLSALDNSQLSLISQAGWGNDLDELAGKPTSANIFTAASGLTSAELAAVKFFGISPGYFKDATTPSLVTALAALSADQQKILRQLGIGHIALEGQNSVRTTNTSITVVPTTSTDYATNIANTLTFYGSLPDGEKTAARALGLGYLLYHYTPDQVLGDSSVKALQRVRDLAQFYLNHPELQQALRDSGLFDDRGFLLKTTPPDADSITATLNTYTSLPERTRTYLAVQNHSVSFYALTTPGSFSPVRTLSDIDAILGALTTAEFSTLLDLKLGRVVLERGDSGDGVILFPFIDGSPVDELQATISYYNRLDTNKKFVLRELGIIGDENIAIIGADPDGLTRLLTAYDAVSPSLRATTEQLDETASSGHTYGSSAGTVQDRSFFFPHGYNENTTMYAVSFQSTGDLWVGATRYLRIDGSTLDGTTFVAGAGKDVYLHAADLIDLNSTAFSAGIRSITMAAATINLTNITFRDGVDVTLKSKLGIANFGSSEIGKVNFISNVSYGSTAITDQQTLDALTKVHVRTLSQ